MFIFFKRNDNCIFLGIIPSFKLMVFSCRQTICFQQHLNELYSVNHHPTLPIGQQPVRDLKGHWMFGSTWRNCNRLPIFPLQNADIGRTSKNTDNIFPTFILRLSAGIVTSKFIIRSELMLAFLSQQSHRSAVLYFQTVLLNPAVIYFQRFRFLGTSTLLKMNLPPVLAHPILLTPDIQ